jgi:hypothetical protein
MNVKTELPSASIKGSKQNKNLPSKTKEPGIPGFTAIFLEENLLGKSTLFETRVPI